MSSREQSPPHEEARAASTSHPIPLSHGCGCPPHHVRREMMEATNKELEERVILELYQKATSGDDPDKVQMVFIEGDLRKFHASMRSWKDDEDCETNARNAYLADFVNFFIPGRPGAIPRPKSTWGPDSRSFYFRGGRGPAS